MAQAWHRGNPAGFAQSVEGLRQVSGIQQRQALKYRHWSYDGGQTLKYDASRHGPQKLWDLLCLVDGSVEAVPGVRWDRTDPFQSYRPVSKSRDPQAGAHVDFIKAKENWAIEGSAAVFDFVNKHGLLGLFFERHSGPILPNRKHWVAPNAVFTPENKLREVDPATEGKALLEQLLRQRFARDHVSLDESLALPSELNFMAKDSISFFGPPQAVGEAFAPEMVGWPEVGELFGCYVVLDKHSWPGVTIMSTREPVFWWQYELENFPSGESLKAEHGFALDVISQRMAGNVSPRGYVNEQGRAERGWRCPYLLKALYLMLYLDLTGGREIRRCEKSGCQEYYRAGPQSSSKYCSTKCANAASTRIGRGQTP